MKVYLSKITPRVFDSDSTGYFVAYDAAETGEDNGVRLFDVSRFVITEENGDIHTPGNIILDNDHKVLGTDTEGSQFNLIELSRWNILDVGTTHKQFNINSSIRPTVQLFGETGEQVHQIAYLSDIADPSNRATGSLVVTGSELSFEYDNIIAKFKRLNSTELQLTLSADHNVTANAVITTYGNATSLTTVKDNLIIDEQEVEIITSPLESTHKIEFTVNTPSYSFRVEAAGNSDYSDAWLIVTRFS